MAGIGPVHNKLQLTPRATVNVSKTSFIRAAMQDFFITTMMKSCMAGRTRGISHNHNSSYMLDVVVVVVVLTYSWPLLLSTLTISQQSYSFQASQVLSIKWPVL